MKHFVAISLVFFSLTQLAQAERTEALKLLAEGYCNQQQVSVQKYTQQVNPQNDEWNTYFLSSGELALIGTLSKILTTEYNVQDQHVSDLMVVEKPNNNSP